MAITFEAVDAATVRKSATVTRVWATELAPYVDNVVGNPAGRFTLPYVAGTEEGDKAIKLFAQRIKRLAKLRSVAIVTVVSGNVVSYRHRTPRTNSTETGSVTTPQEAPVSAPDTTSATGKKKG